MSKIGKCSSLIPDNYCKFIPSRNYILMRSIPPEEFRKAAISGIALTTEYPKHSGYAVIIKIGKACREEYLNGAKEGDVVMLNRGNVTYVRKDMIPESKDDEEFLIVQDTGIIGVMTDYYSDEEIKSYLESFEDIGHMKI